MDFTICYTKGEQILSLLTDVKRYKENVFVGYVKIRVEAANETAAKSDSLFDRYGKFLSELFGAESIFAENTVMGYPNSCFMYGSSQTCIFTVTVGNIPTKRDTQNFLDDCVVLNTYNDYFIRKHDFKCIQIVCGMKCYNSCYEMSLRCKEDILDKKVQFFSLYTSNALMIDELVRTNTDAEKELKGISPQNGFYPYNFMFTKLKENLAKRI